MTVKQLLSSDAHNSGVMVSVALDANGVPQWLYKSSLTRHGIERLKQELAGAEKYSVVTCQPRLKPQLLVETQDRFCFRVSYLHLNKCKYSAGLLKNAALVERALRVYAEIWPAFGENICHGDFSIDNILFKGHEVVFVDWENFTINGPPRGFDMLNLVFEQVYFTSFKFSQARRRAKIAADLLRPYWFDEVIDKHYHDAPLQRLVDSFGLVRGVDIDTPRHPVLKFDQTTIEEIDKQLNLEFDTFSSQ